jgi:hypothetical protein
LKSGGSLPINACPLSMLFLPLDWANYSMHYEG